MHTPLKQRCSLLIALLLITKCIDLCILASDPAESSATSTTDTIEKELPLEDSQSHATTPNSREAPLEIPIADRFNYASVECGAKILNANPEATVRSNSFSQIAILSSSHRSDK